MAFFIRGRSFKILRKGSSTKFASYISNEFKQINQLLFSTKIFKIGIVNATLFVCSSLFRVGLFQYTQLTFSCSK